MYKEIVLFSKKDHQKLAIDDINSLAFAKELKYAPVGLNEIIKLSCKLPILISGGKDTQFVCLMSLSNQNNYFYENKEKMSYVPLFLKTYPFLMINAKDNNKTVRAIAIDIKSEYVGKIKKNKLFEKEDKPSDYLKEKIGMIQFFDEDRNKANELIKFLKEHKLLDKRSLDIKINDGTTKRLLSDFYVVNRNRLYSLDDKVLLKIIKNEWLSVLEFHINSINQIDTLLSNVVQSK